MTQPVRLVLLRHGQSEWNAAGIFTGWENAHLTAHGEAEAARAGSMLAEHGALPAFVHTSLQHRTIRTADLALAAADRDWIPVRRSYLERLRALDPGDVSYVTEEGSTARPRSAPGYRTLTDHRAVLGHVGRRWLRRTGPRWNSPPSCSRSSSPTRPGPAGA